MDIQKNIEGLYEVIVDGETYAFAKWKAGVASETLIELAALLGRPVAVAVGAMKGGDKLEAASPAVPLVFDELLSKLGTHKATVMALLRRLTSADVQCNGRTVRFDEHYQDRLGHMMRVAAAALEVQYGAFFAELGARGGLQGMVTVAERPTPTA